MTVQLNKKMEVNFTFSSQHSKPCSQISMPLEDVVQHRSEVTTQVWITTGKLFCPAGAVQLEGTIDGLTALSIAEEEQE